MTPDLQHPSHGTVVRGAWGLRAAIALSVALVYGQVIDFELVSWDDPAYLQHQPLVEEGLTSDGIAWAFTSISLANWHPLVWLSYMLDRNLFDDWVSGGHLVNAMLHLLNSLLVFEFLRSTTRDHLKAAAAALIFAVHPLHVESVAWLAERKDVLFAFFSLLALMAHVRWVERPSPFNRGLVIVAAMLASMSKAMAMIIPVMLLCADAWPLRRWRGTGGAHPLSALIAEKIPLIVIALTVGAVALVAQGQHFALNPIDGLGPAGRIALVAHGYAGYLAGFLYPVNLSFYYELPAGFAPLGTAAAGAGLIALTFLAWVGRAKRPALLAGWVWFLLTLVPVIGIVHAGLQARADRYMYLPLLGLLIMVFWGLPRPARAWTRHAATIGVVGVIAAFSVRAHHQAGTWRESATLYRHALSVDPGNCIARALLVHHELDRGNMDEAERQSSIALDTCSGKATQRVAHAAAGDVRMALGDPRGAMVRYRQALDLDAVYVRGHVRHAQAAFSARDFTSAIESSGMALRIAPAGDINRRAAWLSLGRSHLEMREFTAARDAFEALLREYPGEVHGLYYLGMARQFLGQRDAAAQAYRKALALDAANANTHVQLAHLYWGDGQVREARRHLGEALVIDPTHPVALELSRRWAEARSP